MYSNLTIVGDNVIADLLSDLGCFSVYLCYRLNNVEVVV